MSSPLLTDLRRAYVDVLAKHKMVYHFDDSVDDIAWDSADPTGKELKIVQALTDILFHDELFKHIPKATRKK